MSIFKGVYQLILDKPYYYRVNQGKKQVETIKTYLKIILNNNNDSDLNYVTIMLCRDFVLADGNFGRDEYEFIKDVFEFSVSDAKLFSYDKLQEYFNAFDYEARLNLKSIITSLDEYTRFALITFGTLICVSDGTLTLDEQQEIEKYL